MKYPVDSERQNSYSSAHIGKHFLKATALGTGAVELGYQGGKGLIHILPEFHQNFLGGTLHVATDAFFLSSAVYLALPAIVEAVTGLDHIVENLIHKSTIRRTERTSDQTSHPTWL